jgi:hypothetical protein
MKSKYLPLLLALLTIGISGAGINRISRINNIKQIGISNGIAAPQAIARIILAHDSIAIANIIESRIEGRQIEAGITEIAA